MPNAHVALPSYECCGVRIDALQPDDAVEELLQSRHGRPRCVHLCNAYTLSLALRDREFRHLLSRGTLNLPDGQPLAREGRRRGHGFMRRRVYGPTLFLETLERGQLQGLRHYLYGSTPDVLDLLIGEIRRLCPQALIAGAESPPFRPLTATERDAMIRRVTASEPDIVWVGLGTPKQDQFVDEYAHLLNATLVAIGAAFDFVAGTKRQAPAWMQDHALEWLYRLATEPRRLWRRYLVGNTVFLIGIARDRISRGRKYESEPTCHR